MEPMILLDLQPPLARLCLNRPQRHNSLVPELMHAFLAGLESIRQEPGVRAVVLCAKGRSFSTGGDLRGFADHLENIQAYSREIVGLLNQAILEMLDLPVPIVAAVNGIVTGGSIGLVLACDQVLLAPQVSFTPYYSVVGFSPDGGWTAMLPTLIGLRRTAGVLASNATISPEQAVAWGMADQIVPAEQLLEEATACALALTDKKAGSLRNIRQLIFQGYGDLPGRLEAELEQFVAQISTQEAQTGLLEFLRK